MEALQMLCSEMRLVANGSAPAEDILGVDISQSLALG
jgi:hypothetical protein